MRDGRNIDGSRGKRIVGYCDPLSVARGESVRFMVSSLDGEPFEARLVRLVCGDLGPDGRRFVEEELASAVNGWYAGRPQAIRCGSCIVVPPGALLARLESLRIELCAWPTALGADRQTLIASWSASGGFALAIDRAGYVSFEVAGVVGDRITLRSEMPLPVRRWTRIVATYDHGTESLALGMAPEGRSPAERLSLWGWQGHRSARAVVSSTEPLLLAAETDGGGSGVDHFVNHFNGRLDECRLGSRAGELPEVCWDFALDIGSDRVTDTGEHGLHGRTVQLPARAVPGVRWTGEVHDWRQDPSQYGAIHFHDDDLIDAGWEASCSLEVTDDLASGAYALRVRTGSSEDYMPFFVVPGSDARPAAVAYLAPTVTYRAYANIRLTASPEKLFGTDIHLAVDNDRFLLDHPECGLGTYAVHSDGSGVMYSSHLRPVLNLKPKGGLWAFTADTNVTAWLHHTGIGYDVLTDDALHARGAAILEPYRVLVTGTHPEYWTTPMLDALEEYLGKGGRLMYMGANGLYWRAAFHPAHPGAIEVRRAEDGTRFWAAEPGEYFHEATGELGGLWRRIGRPPNLLTGIGFAAQGFSRSGHYRRGPGWSNPRVAFATAGIGEREVLGDHGEIGGGAAGQEIDRFDVRLGSPAHAVVLASSENLPADMLLTKEEHLATATPEPGAKVRADVVFFEGPGGGAVFAVGSIAWAASLATDDYDNDVARLSTNVLRRFADPAPFPPPDEKGSTTR